MFDKKNRKMFKNFTTSHSNNLSISKKETIKLTAIMSFSAFIGKIIHFPGTIIIAKFLGPSLLGVLAIINLIRQYAGYTHLGLLQVLPRNVPIAYGKGDKKEAKVIKDTVYSSFFITSAFSVLVLWILFISGITFKGALDVPILILLSLILIAGRTNSFLRSYIKAEGKFMIIGWLDFILKFSPIFSIPAVIFFKLKGVLFAMFLIEVISVGYSVSCLKRPKFHFLINIRKTFQLLKTGFMLFINKIAGNIFWSVDLIILGAMMTTRDVGLYSFALIALRIVEPFSAGINLTIYRKIMIESGKYGIDSRAHFRKYIESPFICYLILNSLVLGFGILVYMLAIRLILTQYSESLLLIIILGFGYMIYASRVFLSFYLNVTNQLNKIFGIILIGLVLNASLDYFLIVNGYGIKGVAFACSLSFLFISAMLIGISFKQIYGNLKSAFSFLFKICLISAILMGVISIFSIWNVFDYTSISSIYTRFLWGTADLVLKALIFSAFCIGIYFLFFNKYRLYEELKPIISYVWYSFTGRLKMDKTAYKEKYGLTEE